eukprot:jgi/Botrbrau1/10737/Bobra.180_2s0007.1
MGMPNHTGTSLSKQTALRNKMLHRPSQDTMGNDESLQCLCFTEVSLGKVIGRGGTATVHVGRWNETDVAVKLLRSSPGTSLSQQEQEETPLVRRRSSAPADLTQMWRSVSNEADILSSVSHPNIVRLKGICKEPPCLLTEWCSRGSLLDILKQAQSSTALREHLRWPLRLRMALQIAKGMQHLHNRTPSILHRDLKTANVLVDASWNCKIADFDFSYVEDERPSRSNGRSANNPRWLAPEVMEGKRHTRAADVYAFGLLLWELLTFEIPWPHLSDFQVVLATVVHRKRPSIPSQEELAGGSSLGSATSSYVGLVHACWADEADSRPSFDSIVTSLDAIRNRLEERC